MIMRGGSSKGAYFLSSDLPEDTAERDDLLLRIMGTPDPRQIDGIGGAHPLTSKVAIVAASNRADVDVEYLFLQLGVDDALVTDRQNCGNLLAGVGPFAIERGLVDTGLVDTGLVDAGLVDAGLVNTAPDAKQAVIRILMRNTGAVATATVPIAAGAPVYEGDTSISGVPGTAAPIRLDFEDVAGGSCGALLPTGNAVDDVDGLPCTLIDAGMPVVVVRASDMGIVGDEDPADLETNDALRPKLERMRLAAGHLMNLGDVSDATVPKLTMVSAPSLSGASLATRTFIPHRCHQAIGVLGAVSVAVAAMLPESPAHELCVATDADSIVLEHPTGTFEAAVTLSPASDSGQPEVERAGIIRTARKLMDGDVYPRSS